MLILRYVLIVLTLKRKRVEFRLFKMIKRKILLSQCLLFCFLQLVCVGNAQNDNKNIFSLEKEVSTGEVEKLDQLIRKTNAYEFNLNKNISLVKRTCLRLDSAFYYYFIPDVPASTNLSWHFEAGKDSVYTVLENKIFHEMKAAKHQTGLEVQLSYLYNFNDWSVDENDLYYRNRAQATLEWNVINSGLIKGAKESKIAAWNGKIDKEKLDRNTLLLYKEEKTKEIDTFYYEKFYQFYYMKTNINKIMVEIYADLFKYSIIPLDELVAQYSLQLNSDTKLNLYRQKLSARITALAKDTLLQKGDDKFDILGQTRHLLEHYLKIDPVLFKSLVRRQIDSTSPYDYKAQICKENAKNAYLEQMKIAPILRYQYLTYPQNIPSKNSFSVGINLSLPISFEAVKKKQAWLEEAEIQLYHKSQLYVDAEEKMDKVLLKENSLILDLQKQFSLINGLRRSIAQQMCKLALTPSDIDYIRLLKLHFNLIDCLIAITDLHYQLSQNLLDAFVLTGGAAVQNYTTIENFSLLDNMFKFPISLHMHENYKASSAEELSSIPFNRQASTVYLSMENRIQDTAFYDAFFKYAQYYGYKVIATVSNLKWLNYNEEQIRTALEPYKRYIYISGIDLAQQFEQLPDFFLKYPHYVALWVKEVEYVRKWCKENNKALYGTVSLPFSNAILTQLDTLFDKTIFRAYGLSEERLFAELDRLEEEVVLKKPLDVSIRPEDYPERWESIKDSIYKKYKKIGLCINSLETLEMINLFHPKIEQKLETYVYCYYIVFHSFLSLKETNYYFSLLKTKYASKVIENTPNEDSQSFYKIVVGPFLTEQAARYELSRLIRDTRYLVNQSKMLKK